MRFPKSLETLADHGVIEEVLRPLMSGKEAQIFLVVAEGEVCAAKIYKDAQIRSFKNRADYVEGRKVRNSRDQRAITKGTKYGKSRDEDAWRSTEVEMIYRLRAANIRVPEPKVFIDGVLLMELVQDHDGHPAPRLGDLQFSPQEAQQIYHMLLSQVVRMLCAGVVHGDLSDFNVLLAWDGPVIIDFPQSVNAAGNQNARALLLRDVANLHRFAARFIPGFRRRPYAEEMWSLYESNLLTPETELTGSFRTSTGPVDTRAVLDLIDDANRDEERRRGRILQDEKATSPAPRRREVIVTPSRPRPPLGGGSRQSGPGGSHAHGGALTPRGPHRNSDGAPQGSRGPDPRSRLHDNRPAHSGPGGGDSRRDGRPLQSRGGPQNESRKPGPKRGAAATASVYVSPEARKTKTLALTPKNETKSEARADRQNSRGPEQRNPRSARSPTAPRENPGNNAGARPRRRRHRRTGADLGSPKQGT